MAGWLITTRTDPQDESEDHADDERLVLALIADRFRLFESLDTWIQRMASRRPVLLVLDDLLWADRPSLLLLLHLVQAPAFHAGPHGRHVSRCRTGPERAPGSPAVPGPRHRSPARPDPGLDRGAITTLLEATTGRVMGERHLALVEELERETAGNPFFLLEMTRHLSGLVSCQARRAPCLRITLWPWRA